MRYSFNFGPPRPAIETNEHERQTTTTTTQGTSRRVRAGCSDSSSVGVPKPQWSLNGCRNRRLSCTLFSSEVCERFVLRAGRSAAGAAHSTAKALTYGSGERAATTGEQTRGADGTLLLPFTPFADGGRVGTRRTDGRTDGSARAAACLCPCACVVLGPAVRRKTLANNGDGGRGERVRYKRGEG